METLKLHTAVIITDDRKAFAALEMAHCVSTDLSESF
jgi:hypothetical protein